MRVCIFGADGHVSSCLGGLFEEKKNKNIFESGDIIPQFLTLALDGGEWSASLLWRFSSGKRATGTGFTEG
jgi:hypothetical protein